MLMLLLKLHTIAAMIYCWKCIGANLWYDAGYWYRFLVVSQKFNNLDLGKDCYLLFYGIPKYYITLETLVNRWARKLRLKLLKYDMI